MTRDIYPCLWFDTQAEEAARFYCTVFPESRVVSVNPVVSIFEVHGKTFMALNGGPMFKHSEAVSFVITCADQQEIDYYWEKLTSDGGQESMCGWCKDKYGVSWQVIPEVLGSLMNDPERAGAVTQAFLKMRKFDIAALLAAK